MYSTRLMFDRYIWSIDEHLSERDLRDVIGEQSPSIVAQPNIDMVG